MISRNFKIPGQPYNFIYFLTMMMIMTIDLVSGLCACCTMLEAFVRLFRVYTYYIIFVYCFSNSLIVHTLDEYYESTIYTFVAGARYHQRKQNKIRHKKAHKTNRCRQFIRNIDHSLLYFLFFLF